VRRAEIRLAAAGEVGPNIIFVVVDDCGYDIAWDPRERGNLARKKPELLAELRALWEAWDATMPPVPPNLPQPMKNLSDMLW
jgi:hypothetical protein